jgi:hypothetical protein
LRNRVLIAGPATNAAAITTIWKVLGRRTVALYLITVIVSAIGCGLLLDWLVPAVEAALPQLGEHVHATAQRSWPANVAAIVLIAVLVFSYFSKVLNKEMKEGQ